MPASWHLRGKLYLRLFTVLQCLYCTKVESLIFVVTKNQQQLYLNVLKVKVKQSHCRPWGFQEVGAPRFQDNRHFKVIKLSALFTGCLYPQEIFLAISYRLSQWKISMIPSEIEPATFRLVAPCRNQPRHPMPPISHNAFYKTQEGRSVRLVLYQRRSHCKDRNGP